MFDESGVSGMAAVYSSQKNRLFVVELAKMMMNRRSFLRPAEEENEMKPKKGHLQWRRAMIWSVYVDCIGWLVVVLLWILTESKLDDVGLPLRTNYIRCVHTRFKWLLLKTSPTISVGKTIPIWGSVHARIQKLRFRQSQEGVWGACRWPSCILIEEFETREEPLFRVKPCHYWESHIWGQSFG